MTYLALSKDWIRPLPQWIILIHAGIFIHPSWYNIPPVSCQWRLSPCPDSYMKRLGLKLIKSRFETSYPPTNFHNCFPKWLKAIPRALGRTPSIHAMSRRERVWISSFKTSKSNISLDWVLGYLVLRPAPADGPAELRVGTRAPSAGSSREPFQEVWRIRFRGEGYFSSGS